MDTTTWVMVGLLVLMIVALIVVPMFTNKKRAKQISEIHSALVAGDVIKTVGGLIGKILEIRQISPTDKIMVIETGSGDNKSTLTFDIQAFYQVVSKNAAEFPVFEQEAQSGQQVIAEVKPEDETAAVKQEEADDSSTHQEPAFTADQESAQKAVESETASDKTETAKKTTNSYKPAANKTAASKKTTTKK